MNKHPQKNAPIIDTSLHAGMSFDDLFPVAKPEKDKAMMEHEAFHTNNKPNADEVQWQSKAKPSTNIANSDAFDALMKAADIESDLLSNKAKSKNRNNSYKR